MIFIGIGSNLGERWQNLSQAWQRLEAADIRVIASSPVYETAPWGEPDQPPYLNAVWAVESALSPEALLVQLQAIEVALGRPARLRSRWEPRTLDLDLLAYGTETRETPTLTLPHPWIPHRAFVLGPWNDLAPYFYLPKWQATVHELWQRCCSPSWGRRVDPPPLLPWPLIRPLPIPLAGKAI